MVHRGELSDAQWERLRPLLPPQKPRTGRPNKAHRTVVNAILWIDRTGAPWRDLPERYGPWKTVYSRFQRWRRAGIWDRVFAALQAEADAAGAVDWEVHFVDGTTVRAHQHAAGAAGTDAATEALGRSRGGFSTKLHLKAEGTGKPMAVAVTPGQRHESTAFAGLMRQGAVKRPGRGRPKVRPRRVAGDRSYSSRAIRAGLRRRGIRATIPRRSDQRHRGRFDRAAYRLRNRVERLINRLKQFRRVATRYEKRGAAYRAMVVIACILLWL
jgi:transposase